MTGGSGFGLTAAAKAGLLKRFATKSGPSAAGVTPIVKPAPDSPWTNLPLYKDLNSLRELANGLGIADPFFRSHEGIATGQTLIGNQTYINFSAYDYLGLNGDPRITKASMAAIERYGTSVSASRLVSGERPLHRELEEAIAGIYGTEDAVCFVSGHATNVTVIGQILKPGDLILHDELSHNSILQGAQLSGAKRFGFAHNEPAALEKLLKAHRKGATRALIVIEGHYSMDGDVPDLPRFVALAKAHDCWLMVDEAHGLGVLGEKGYGIHEHCGVASTDVDIWMGTLSKTLVSCGGYIAGRRELVDYLKRTAPGFVYSVGIAPAVAAAALEATKIFRAEPERVARLKANGQRFRAGAQAAGFDTGQSIGASIVPVITGSSMKAAKLSAGLMDRGVNVQPILYPAVPERTSRLRFFISAAHTDQQIDDTIQILAEEWKK